MRYLINKRLSNNKRYYPNCNQSFKIKKNNVKQPKSEKGKKLARDYSNCNQSFKNNVKQPKSEKGQNLARDKLRLLFQHSQKYLWTERGGS